MKRVLAFDVWSHFAYFRRHYTTTSASTHPFIPRSAVEGLVGAIVGYRSEEYPDLLWDARIAIELRKSGDLVQRITKVPFGISYTHSDFWQQVGRYLRSGGNLNHVPAPRSIEILKEPKYRIYFSSEHSGVYSQLLQNLREHHTHYTPYLGSSNMLANFELVGEYEITAETESSSKAERIVSIIPFFKRIPQVKVEQKSHYGVEQNLPLHLNSERKATGYYSAIYSPEPGQTIIASNASFSTLKMGSEEFSIAFIPTTPSPA
jgi:CRISPR-associated protein Cas5h